MEGWKIFLLILFSNLHVIFSQDSLGTSNTSTTAMPTTSTTEMPTTVTPMNEPMSESELPNLQLQPFKQLNRHGVRTGPIMIIDNKTFYIPNLHYDGKGPNAHFWAGNGTEPDANGILVPDENGSLESISAYNGQNLIIRLPENLTVHSIEYFGLWCIQFNQTFGYVNIPKNLVIPPRGVMDRKLVLLQRCCPETRTLKNKTCIMKNPQSNANVQRDHKAFESLRMSSLEYFVNNINCPDKSLLIQLKANEFVFDNNASFVYLKTNKTLSQDDYCIDRDDSVGGAEDSALICIRNNSQLFFVNIYILIVSMLWNIF